MAEDTVEPVLVGSCAHPATTNAIRIAIVVRSEKVPRARAERREGGRGDDGARDARLMDMLLPVLSMAVSFPALAAPGRQAAYVPTRQAAKSRGGVRASRLTDARLRSKVRRPPDTERGRFRDTGETCRSRMVHLPAIDDAPRASKPIRQVTVDVVAEISGGTA